MSITIDNLTSTVYSSIYVGSFTILFCLYCGNGEKRENSIENEHLTFGHKIADGIGRKLMYLHVYIRKYHLSFSFNFMSNSLDLFSCYTIKCLIRIHLLVLFENRRIHFKCNF